MRADLFALTPDALEVLSNRGLVKRAQKEWESGSFSWQIHEDEAGSITVQWSDGVECLLPAQKTLSQSTCSCASTTLCRHLLRSVLAYQHHHVAPPPPESSQGESAPPPAPAPTPWDPGTISDTHLSQVLSKSTLLRSQQLSQSPHLLELVRSRKPTCTIHTLACRVRFLVPGDPRYTYCDCAEPDPCSHVPLAIQAFRLLDPAQKSGLIHWGDWTLRIPEGVLAATEQELQSLWQIGLAAITDLHLERLKRQEIACRSADLIWPADILSDIRHEIERYRQHDARFSPIALVEQIGEWCIRRDAICYANQPVPQLFIRGLPSDRPTDVGSARLIGLGCGVVQHRQGVELSAYLQDMDSGVVVAVCREFADPPPPDKPRHFGQLAQTPAFKGISLATLASGQVMVKGGKRTSNGQFLPGRSAAHAHPQSFQWEHLQSSILAEDFAEVVARLATQPPRCLGPRRLTYQLGVCQVKGISEVAFWEAEQAVYANLLDTQNQTALLRHPYTSRSAAGTEALLTALRTRGEQLCFVAGQFSYRSDGLQLSPIALIFEEGGQRTMLQPWIEQGEVKAFSSAIADMAWRDPRRDFPGAVIEALGELLVLGLTRLGSREVEVWRQLCQQGSALGFVRYLAPMTYLADLLEQKSKTLTWDPQPALPVILQIVVLSRLAQESLIGNQSR
ncbi:MAG: hypothetical protein NW237_03970 [Cyanobacteriota bacterium]|nr:hypothetical protein [Cyanobacteriota bacterium]